MLPLKRWQVAIVCLLACCPFAGGQAQSGCSQAPNSGALCVDKIDPPDWWAGLPNPMLLVHGKGLAQAQFSVQGKDVKLIRTQSSSNGHWAFLWLETRTAAAQTLWIDIVSGQGRVRKPYVLAARSREPNAHSGFSSADVLYLIMPDRFANGNPANDQPGLDRSAPRGWHGGDLVGIRQHLDYLKQLGVTAVWTTPVASNGAMPESYHGYAATDLYAVDSHLGTLDDYRHLSDALHARGMKLVIDLVPNHVGVQHPWVLDPPAPDWLHDTLQHHHAVQYDFYQLLDAHAPERAWHDITNGWFTDAMPDLNQENPLVSQYLIQNALWWVETAAIDGIRLDTFPYVGRTFWHQFHAELHSVYPHLTTVGEVMNADPEVTSFFAGGVAHNGIDTGLDTPFDYPLHFELQNVLAHGKPMTDLAALLRQDSLYPHPERLVPFIGNHDMTRFLTEAGGSVPKLKLAVGLLLTLRGTPQLYAGDEIGMMGGPDPDNRRDFPGGFAGDTHNAFTRAERTPTEEEIFSWTSGLLALRASHPELQTGVEENIFADNDVFAFVRTPNNHGCSTNHAEKQLLIVANKSSQNKVAELPVEDTALAGCTSFRLASPTTGNVPALTGATLHIDEPAESISIYEVR